MLEIPRFESASESPKSFEVVEQKVGDGAMYDVYFDSLEAMDDAIRKFWALRSPWIMTQIESRNTKQLREEITAEDRSVRHVYLPDYEASEHPDMVCKVNFNGNTSALSSKGIEALKAIGYL